MIDVGANVGDYSALAASLVGPSGRVYAFEPAPANVVTLRNRFQIASNVSVIPAAVGERAGAVTLFLDRRESTRHSLASGNVGKAGEVIRVQQVALDDYCETLSRADVVKVDAQGAELNIVRGALRFLEHHRPHMVLELWPHGLRTLGASAELLLDTLEACGYSVFRLSAKGPLKPKRFVDEFLELHSNERWRSINILATRSGEG